MAQLLKRRGLTLAEVLLGLGLTTVTLLSVIALAISALRSQHKSSDIVVAQGYADEVMERFIYGLPASTADFWRNTSFATPYATDSVQIGGQTYTCELRLTPQNGNSGLLRCAVNVSWQSGEAGRTGQGRQTLEALRLIYAH